MSVTGPVCFFFTDKPDHVLFYKDLLPELRSRIERKLDDLVKAGKVNRSNTINDTAYGND